MPCQWQNEPNFQQGVQGKESWGESWTVMDVLCLPRLKPSGPLSILHSSICPKDENITRMSFSLHFLDIIPIKSFLSSTAKKLKNKIITSKAAPAANRDSQSSRVLGSPVQLYPVVLVCEITGWQRKCTCSKRQSRLQGSENQLRERETIKGIRN